MQTRFLLSASCAATAVLITVPSVHADGGFYGDPPDATHPWAIHDGNRPQPVRVEPGTFSTQEQPGKPPSDAVVLFDGTEASLKKWVSDKNPDEPTKWIVKDGAFQCTPGAGYVRTKELHGDIQLHIEWSAPEKVEGHSQGRGNSGVFLQGEVEVQVLDNYNNPTYADGFAGSVYGVNPPMANPLNAPGQWQVYDIVYRRPLFDGDKEIDPGSLTVFLNGVLVQQNTALEGGGGHRGRSKARPFPDLGPLKLQDHGNPVRYRNIWFRALPKRTAEGGDTSRMSEEATAKKKAEIAQSVREDAQSKSGLDKTLRLAESLTYEMNGDVLGVVTAETNAFAEAIKNTSKDQLEGKKGEIMRVHGALDYLSRFKLVPDALPAQSSLKAVISAQEWDKK